MKQTRILFVCLGNICRSPMAEGVFRHVCEENGRGQDLVIDSAGTGGWHIGNPPDHRAIAAAAGRGIDISAQRARQVAGTDFQAFDHIIAMDEDNLETLLARAPEDTHSKVSLFLEGVPGIEEREVPDPYYGGEEGFDHALDLIEAASRALLARLP